MATGTVKWFNTNKGYGFIAPDNGGKDVFVHITELEKSGIRQLDDGQKISYEISENRGKEAASSIQLID
ncbi:MAG: cold-shock protein [Emcibacter sp.]|nr:cold-shock protein [Emcibacter sp.]